VILQYTPELSLAAKMLPDRSLVLIVSGPIRGGLAPVERTYFILESS
jgi:hypothetical protein